VSSDPQEQRSSNDILIDCTEEFKKEQEAVRKLFLIKKLDEDLVAIIDEPHKEAEAQSFYLGIDFADDEASKMQFELERKFISEYPQLIAEGKWTDILEDIYPPLDYLADKKTHFINLSYCLSHDGAFANGGLNNFWSDRENLKKAIAFEVNCEETGQVALLRGAELEDWPSFHNRSYSFGRGLYSGILSDDAFVGAHALFKEYLLGLKVKRKIFSECMVIPPFSWFRHLGFGGELWHPRTTVANITPLDDREKPSRIKGIALVPLIDKSGVFIKPEDSESHFGKVKKLRLEILQDNTDRLALGKRKHEFIILNGNVFYLKEKPSYCYGSDADVDDSASHTSSISYTEGEITVLALGNCKPDRKTLIPSSYSWQFSRALLKQYEDRIYTDKDAIGRQHYVLEKEGSRCIYEIELET
jgi:hypothetical protein